MAEYIEREALLKAVAGWRTVVKSLYDSGYDDCINSIEDTISDAAAADVEPVVHAKWIPQYENRFGRTNIFECSKCNKTIHTMHKTYKCSDLYCSNCGAKMDGGEIKNV